MLADGLLAGVRPAKEAERLTAAGELSSCWSLEGLVLDEGLQQNVRVWQRRMLGRWPMGAVVRG